MAQVSPVRDEKPQLGEGLVCRAHLGKVPPPEPELIGDDLASSGSPLRSPHVGLPDAVYRDARRAETFSPREPARALP